MDVGSSIGLILIGVGLVINSRDSFQESSSTSEIIMGTPTSSLTSRLRTERRRIRLRQHPTDPAAAEPPPQARRAVKAPTTIFISYRRQDSGDVTGRIYDRLVQQFGREAIFKDVDSIPLGVDFRISLGDAVGQCNLLLAVIGRRWLSIQNESGARPIGRSARFRQDRDRSRVATRHPCDSAARPGEPKCLAKMSCLRHCKRWSTAMLFQSVPTRIFITMLTV